jgi:hypothetical protein
MIQDILLACSGIAVFIASSITLWMCRARTDGADRWFVGGAYEIAIALLITSGLVVGLGMLVTGVLSSAGAG